VLGSSSTFTRSAFALADSLDRLMQQNNFSSTVTIRPTHYHQVLSSGASQMREHTSTEYKRKMLLLFFSSSRACLSPLLLWGPAWQALPYYEQASGFFVLLPGLQDVVVMNQRRAPNSISVGSYAISRYRDFLVSTLTEGLIRALMAQVRQRKIEIMDNVLRHKIIEISARYWKKRWKGSWCIKGAIGIDVRKKKIVRFECKSLILVSGGYTRVYAVSSSRIFENYEGVALAYQGRE